MASPHADCGADSEKILADVFGDFDSETELGRPKHGCCHETELVAQEAGTRPKKRRRMGVASRFSEIEATEGGDALEEEAGDFDKD